MDSKFAENLRMARLTRGYSQQNMAEMLGISRSAYAGYEIGRRSPNLELLLEMAEILYVSVDDLLGRNVYGTPGLIAEARTQYGAKSDGLSLNDYLSMMDCIKYELLEGKLIQWNAPGYIHQRIQLQFSMQLEQYLQNHCRKCVVLPAPFCVVLDEMNATVVQPDISVICNPDQIKDDICYGPPEIVVEILSPTTQDYDSFDKLMLYKHYDVGEYWIVNPEEKRVILYDLQTGKSPVIGSFTTAIPSFRIKGFALTLGEIKK